ncbi:unnamed protein product [Cylicostephanus goldi]|uniref:Uncharacterized protein n=1 Tax=Cylicostephanus goldi TaxID=71465 RepID=A0A3P6TP90_CYLGO|nr:unnamed protein product [Cylicostephanus goldi]
MFFALMSCLLLYFPEQFCHRQWLLLQFSPNQL